MRGRQTAAMLEMLGLPQLVARDAADFARVAMELAADGDFNAGVRQAIARRREVLFDQAEPVTALRDALLKIASG